MHAGDLHESIGHHEEFIFELVSADEARYPELLALWHGFYDDPRIPAESAGRLVHELIDLLSLNGGLDNRRLARTVLRLLPFFSRAYRAQLEIRCDSD